MDNHRLVCILGATGTGKTAAGVRLAQALGRQPGARVGGVINMDARQVYRGLPIVTAQPSPEETEDVPHLLYGFVPPDQAVCAGEYAGLVLKGAAELREQGRTPLLVGGTGMYADAVEMPLADIPKIDPAVRAAIQARIDAEGPETLHAELARSDPAYAGKIHPNDQQRICRALEVFAHTGRTLSQWHALQPKAPRCKLLKLVLHMDRQPLKERLAQRIDLMLEAGAMDEARAAYQACPKPDAPGFNAIGCREVLDVLQSRRDLDEAKRVWLKRTTDYAKRQVTWFRRYPDAVWLAPDQHDRIAELAQAFLRGEHVPGGGAPDHNGPPGLPGVAKPGR